MKKELTIHEHLEKICDWFDAGCYVDYEAHEMIQNAQEALKQAKTLSKAHVSSSFICDECKNKITAGMLCEPCSSVGQVMQDGGVCRTHNICNDCCRCREYDSE